MDRLRQSFGDLFRNRKDPVPKSSKQDQREADKEAVRSSACSFAVKYLGCIEVFEPRGEEVCKAAFKVLRKSRPVRGRLYVSGDGLRVVDDVTSSLIVNQAVEQVNYCTPDRNHERGFTYICRDITTDRWMCHGFLASKDSGDRLSYAVGCAFDVCLERKQRRDKKCKVTMKFDTKTSTFTRTGSFRRQTLTERLVSGPNEQSVDTPFVELSPQPKPFEPFTIERPHATSSMLERQRSFRGLSTIGSQSPFKRQMSFRINDLPSNTQRQKAFRAAHIPQASPEKLKTDIKNGGNALSQLCEEVSEFVESSITPKLVTPTPPSAGSIEVTNALPSTQADPWVGQVVVKATSPSLMKRSPTAVDTSKNALTIDPFDAE